MTPGVVSELRRVGLSSVFDGCLPITRGHVEGPKGQAFDVDLAKLRPDLGTGFVVPRRDFDDRLAQLAVEAGAEFIQGVSNLEFEFRPGASQVSFTADSEPVTVSAQLIVGADGAYSAVRRALGLTSNSKRANGLAMRGYADSSDFAQGGKFGETLWFEFNEKLIPAYGWVFPTGTGLCNVGVGLQQDQLAKRGLDLRGVLDQFVVALGHHGARLEGLRDVKAHQLPHVREIPTLAHRGVALVGDAASLINPTTGEGIGYAVASSRLLIESLPERLNDPEGLDGALRRYEDRLRKEYRAHFRSVRLAQRLLEVPKWTNLVFRAAVRDDDVKRNAVDLLFGNGTITPSSTLAIARASLR